MSLNQTPYRFRKARNWLCSFLILAAFVPLALSSVDAAAPPFALPFAGTPGPSTWYVAQWYGSTVWAYRNWHDQYGQGQGLHFGVDFAAPCGTPIHSIGDGVVYSIDGPFGAGPHNIVINHEDGYYSLYGHMFKRSTLQIGQHVSKGDVLGISGDPTNQNCNQSSHLHLEIRRAGMSVAVDPVPLINADWRSLTIGADTDGTKFELFYSDPGKLMTNDDQPDTHFGGPILNHGNPAWPPS